MTDNHYDIAILGAGSAGYWAARTAAKHGVRTALIDPGPLGGLCILRGCMPTKTLLRSTEVLHLAKHASEVGVLVGEVGYDFAKMMERKRHWVNDFASYRAENIVKQDGFELIEAAGTFLDKNTLKCGDRTITADKIIVATGSYPWVPQIPGLADVGYITSDEALELKAPPKSMMIVGGGVIALEMGQFFARLGTEVTLLLRGKRVLSNEDEDIAHDIQCYMEAEGIKVVNNAAMHSFECREGTKVVHGTREGVTFEHEACEVMVCVGRAPNLSKLNMHLCDIKPETHRVELDAYLRTCTDKVYVVGDASGRWNIVHVAIQEGIYAVEHALGKTTEPFDERLLAWAIFCDPNVARVGKSEGECQKANIPHVVGTYRFDDQGKALVANLTKGFVKVVAHAETGEILGAAVVGAEGADLIHEMIVAMYFRATCKQFLEIPHLHPTLSEIWLDPVEECEEKRLALKAEAVK